MCNTHRHTKLRARESDENLRALNQEPTTYEAKRQRLPETVAPIVYNTKQVAAMLSVSPLTVWRWNKRGLLKRLKACRHLLFPRTEIDRFIKSNLE
jgi:hypothetical protein